LYDQTTKQSANKSHVCLLATIDDYPRFTFRKEHYATFIFLLSTFPRRSSHSGLWNRIECLRLRSANRHQRIMRRCRLNSQHLMPYDRRAFSIVGRRSIAATR